MQRVDAITVASLDTKLSIIIYDEELRSIVEDTIVTVGTKVYVTGQISQMIPGIGPEPMPEAKEVEVFKRFDGGSWQSIWKGKTWPVWVPQPANFAVLVNLDKPGLYEFQALFYGDAKYNESISDIAGC